MPSLVHKICVIALSVEAGSSARAAGRVFGVSESTAVKWVQRWRRTGTVAAKWMGGYARSPLEDHAALVLGFIAERPDLTIEEVRAALRARGIGAGHGSVWRFFNRHGISFKKNRARQRAGSARRGGGAPTVAAKSRHA